MFNYNKTVNLKLNHFLQNIAQSCEFKQIDFDNAKWQKIRIKKIKFDIEKKVQRLKLLVSF